jgi:hypothetical protein
MKTTKIKYTKKMKEFLAKYGLGNKPVKFGKFTPEMIKFFQEQNDKYDFTIEDAPVSGSFRDDMMEYGEMNNSDYFID